ncbi:hypothetical protein ACIP6T_11005 [Pantoea sp. NPDC088449]|uniref:hypothetical protein n=1 Tax=Pantoea sp. NPDC088449 TaxID=3364392 RepID=UPI0038199386
MIQKILDGTNFPSIDEMRYVHIAEKKQDFAVYTGMIPVVFLNNPRKINLHSLQISSGYGMVFFRSGAEQKVKSICNIFSGFDCYYSTHFSQKLGQTDDWPLAEGDSIKPAAKSCNQYILPTGLEPHEGIEYPLMHKALKHVAIFEYFIPVEFITNPLCLDLKFIEYKGGSGRIYYRPGHDITAKELKKEVSNNINPYDEEHVRRIGRLLGYQPSDIAHLIDYIRDREKFYA